MKTLIFSDLHAHNYREFSEIDIMGINSRLGDCVRVLVYLKMFCEEQHIDRIVFTGDVFHIFGVSCQVVALF
jgi:metallophosphoesterase superfamily enzyme